MSELKVFVVPLGPTSCEGYRNQVRRLDDMTDIHLPEPVPHAESYEVTIRPRKSKRERKIEAAWNALSAANRDGWRDTDADRLVDVLEAIDKETP